EIIIYKLPTVTASQVPSLFREPYILSGCRPVQQDWRCYLLSLFQKHNESLNVWTHLLAGPVLLLRWWANVDTLGCTLDDVTSLPLLLFLVSSLTYLYLSAAAHLLQSHSERAHYFFFLDYVGVACIKRVGVIFLPGAAFFGWLSCTGCCYAKFRYRRPYPPQRKVCQLIPTGLAYVLDISPVAHRLLTVSWSQEPSLPFHALQIACFLLSALFFSCSIPEPFFPGNCDFVGQGHQIFHVLLSLCTLSQLAGEHHCNSLNTCLCQTFIKVAYPVCVCVKLDHMCWTNVGPSLDCTGTIKHCNSTPCSGYTCCLTGSTRSCAQPFSWSDNCSRSYSTV
uniref:Progestin and adipoQ receptor family member VIII n=1 Tax=Haplochromis burtoni TaxID=8153 RepID=A0A3Q2VEK9_HAPBU